MKDQQIIRCSLVLLVCALCSGLPSRAEKIWTNSASGLWSDSLNWSGHTPPDVTSFIRITNANTKTITINANTASTNLTVQNLLLNAPPGQTNLLLLSNAGISNPLIFQFGLELQDGAAIRITNSALQTQLANDHINMDGSFTLDSGSFDFGDNTVTSRVGRVTSGVLTINGGTGSAGVMTIGGLTNSSGLLQVSGGTLNLSGLLSVARNQSTTGTVSLVGGQINVPNDDTRIGDSGIAFVTISNATMSVTNVEIGRDPAALGQVTIQSGGLLQAGSAVTIGKFTGSTGLVSVVGGGLLAKGQRISVGQRGTGQLTVSGGTVQSAQLLVVAEGTNSVGASGLLSIGNASSVVASNLAVGSASYSTGQVLITGGVVAVTNAGSSGLLKVSSGSVDMSGGSLTVDAIVLTNTAGSFLFSGGLLASKGTTVANGSAFVIGDGVHPATFQMNGGTHSFANGLVISANATLDGCGTVLGNVVNHGTISTNCGVVAPVLSFVNRTGATNIISFGSTAGVTYTLQFKNSLNDSLWTSLPPATNGTGQTIVLKDVTASGGARLYRILAQ